MLKPWFAWSAPSGWARTWMQEAQEYEAVIAKIVQASGALRQQVVAEVARRGRFPGDISAAWSVYDEATSGRWPKRIS